MTNTNPDHMPKTVSIPHCLHCPDTPLRLIDRGAFAAASEISPLQPALRDDSLTVEVWVCPDCRRIELRYPEELPLPETPEERQTRRLELRMNQYPADKLRRMAEDPQLSEEERAAAARILSRRRD